MPTLSSSGRYCKYLRKSRADEMREILEGVETLARHDKTLDELAERLGIVISKTFKEVVTGESLEERTEMQSLLQELRDGKWDGVLTMEVERLSRGDATDQGIVGSAFLYSQTLIITPMKIYDPLCEADMEYFEFGLFMSRREYKSITRRLQQGRVKSAKEGQYMGSIAPFGWRKIDVNGKHTLELGEYADKLKYLYESIAEWSSNPTHLADEFNALGIPTPRNKYWDKSTIVKIIKNPVNKGYIRWNEKKTVTELDENMNKVKRRVQNNDVIIARGLHEAFIPEDLWDRANQQLANHAGSSVHSYKPLKNIFAGLMFCSECGRTMHRVSSARPNGDKHYYFEHSHSNRRDCWQKGTPYKVVIDMVCEALLSLAHDMEVYIEAGDDSKRLILEEKISAYERELKSDDAAVDNLFRLVEKGLISDEEFAERKEKIEEAKHEKRRHIERIVEELSNIESYEAKVTSIHAIIADIRNFEDHETQVNVGLKQFIERIEYTRGREDKKPTLNIIMK